MLPSAPHHNIQQHVAETQDVNEHINNSYTAFFGDDNSKSSISKLQELIMKDSVRIRLPPRRSILQWSFSERFVNNCSLQFCATVAFLLEGVPYHVKGDWQTSKKVARTDVAEKALHLLISQRGQHKTASRVSIPDTFCEGDGNEHTQVLCAYCQIMPMCNGIIPQWSIQQEGQQYRAIVEVSLHGVLHTFGGTLCNSESVAYSSAASRILYYLQCPGYEDAFELDYSTICASDKIPPPPAEWEGGALENEMTQANRRFVKMHLQNRLQQEFGKLVQQGTSVWEWRYEYDDESSEDCSNMLCRAFVRIPVANQEFTSMWCRGQRSAETHACSLVNAFLDNRSSWNFRPVGLQEQ